MGAVSSVVDASSENITHHHFQSWSVVRITELWDQVCRKAQFFRGRRLVVEVLARHLAGSVQFALLLSVLRGARIPFCFHVACVIPTEPARRFAPCGSAAGLAGAGRWRVRPAELRPVSVFFQCPQGVGMGGALEGGCGVLRHRYCLTHSSHCSRRRHV